MRHYAVEGTVGQIFKGCKEIKMEGRTPDDLKFVAALLFVKIYT